MSPHPAYDRFLAPRAPCQRASPSLAQGQLHEIHACVDDWAAALGFALAPPEARRRGPTVLLRSRARLASRMPLHGEGLAGLGIDPASLLIVETSDEQALLRAAHDAARCAGLAAVVLETWGNLPRYDLTASRRFVLAAERSQVSLILLRGDAHPRASAAHTRWSIRSQPSIPLPGQAPGGPVMEVELLRQRGGPAGMRWRLAWNDKNGFLLDNPAAARPDTAPPSGLVVPFPALRAG